jgi:hypothetical protein
VQLRAVLSSRQESVSFKQKRRLFIACGSSCHKNETASHCNIKWGHLFHWNNKAYFWKTPWVTSDNPFLWNPCYFFQLADLRGCISVFYNSTVSTNVQEIRSWSLRWSWLHFKPISQLSATAVLVDHPALTLHLVHNYVVWRRTEIKGAQTATGTLCW